MSEIITVSGRSVELRPVSANVMEELRISVRRKAIARGDPLEPPVYETVTVTGEKQSFPHDETTLETDEDKEKWATHKEALAQLVIDTNTAVVRYMISEGLEGCEPPEEWAVKRAFYGLETPENPMERRLLYIEQEILPTQNDVANAVNQIMHLTAKGNREMESRLGELDDLFRRAMERREATTESDAG